MVVDREGDNWSSLRRWPLPFRPQSPVWLALPADWQEHSVLRHMPLTLQNRALTDQPLIAMGITKMERQVNGSSHLEFINEMEGLKPHD